MTAPSQLPWYRRPLPWWLPPWLALGALGAAAGGYFATYIRDYTALTVAAGFGVGLFAALAFCLAVAGRATPDTAPDVALFRPPQWLARPVLVGVLVIVANGAIDRGLRQGDANWSSTRRGGRQWRVTGPFAVVVGGCLLAVAGYSCVAGVWGRPRATSAVVGGLLGAVVFVVGLGGIVVRIWDHFS